MLLCSMVKSAMLTIDTTLLVKLQTLTATKDVDQLNPCTVVVTGETVCINSKLMIQHLNQLQRKLRLERMLVDGLF
jgi:hypothetical protein